MPNYTKEQWNAKKEGLMEKCYDCFAEYGLHGTGIRALGKHCGCTPNNLAKNNNKLGKSTKLKLLPSLFDF